MGMRTLNPSLKTWLKMLVPALLAITTSVAQAAPTFWTGQDFTYVHPLGSGGETADEITTSHVGPDFPNNVWITRAATGLALYNAAAESGWDSVNNDSPKNTLWAVASGPLTSATNLTFDTFYNVVGHPAGDSPGWSVGMTFFVHIVSDDIYFQLHLDDWGSHSGYFQYTRSTPAAVTPPTPTVSLTNPVASAVFAAPASLKLKATAAVSSGSVTNVQFFANTTTSLGSAMAAPFNVTSSPLAAGSYALTAVATAAGISATSTVVNVSVVNPANVNLSAPHIATGQVSFNYSANVGLTYVVQSSSNLFNWVSLSTNTAASSPVPFSAPTTSRGATYYRVGRQPNP